MDHVVNFIQSLVFHNILFQKKHIVAANHNMWSNSAIRECVDVYDELSHFIELPMDRFTHTTHFTERHRKFEVIFIRFSDAYRTIRITSIRIFTSRLVRKRCYFRYCTYLWADLITLVRKKGTGFDIRTKKATHQSTIRKFDTIRWDSITSNILCLHCILYSQVNNLLTIITRHIHRHYLYKTIAFEQFSQKQLR